MKCKLCEKEFDKLAESHILAKGFFRYMYPKDDNRAFLSSNGKSRPKRIRTGYYDNEILCIECDNNLGKYDDYAISAFTRKKIVPFPNSDQAYLMNNVIYSKLKMFFLSLLYRASITSREEFSLINLGEHYEKTLKEMIIKEDIGEFNDFPFIIAKFETAQLPQDIADKSLMSPYRTKIDNINFSVFRIPGGYQAYIKVDKRPLDDLFNQLAIKRDGNLIIIRRENFESSKEFKAMCDVIIK
ncbi:MAG: hypothetical protein V1867_05340 [Candidatus Falkowbacteria bacterium]